jgi:ribosomal protein S18 acetylase RimI-like enzyme
LDFSLNNIRKAILQDATRIAEFNIAMARETEGKELLPQVIHTGVANLIANPERGFYLVCENYTDAGAGAEPMGSLMVTTEWSDWRNGNFWWIQSVYVKPDHRQKGIYRAMYSHLKGMAKADANVCGFRLYVEQENVTAQKTYESLGMARTDYLMYEELKAGVEFLKL